MKIRIAKKIVKNAEKLAYHKHQIEKAELVVKRWKKMRLLRPQIKPKEI